LTFTDDPEANHAAAIGLADLVTAGRVASILVERADGMPVLQPGGRASAALTALLAAGFVRTPRGLRRR
ncbi:hypothetical protein, partial [Mycobacterium tuberculosis]